MPRSKVEGVVRVLERGRALFTNVRDFLGVLGSCPYSPTGRRRGEKDVASCVQRRRWPPRVRGSRRKRNAVLLDADRRTVRARIEELAEHPAADEIMVTTNVCEHAERLRTYERLAGCSASSSGRPPSPRAARKERE